MQIKFCHADADFKLIAGAAVSPDARFVKGAEKPLRLFALKNDTAAFSLVIQSDRDCVLNVGDEPFFSQLDQKPHIRIAVCSELPHSLNIVDLHECESGLRYADALLPRPTLEIAAGETRQVYVEFAPPKGCEAGGYKFKINIFTHEMFGDETLAGGLEGEIEIADFTLHDPKDNKFHLDLWQHPSNLARKAEAPLWSDRHFAVIERYLKSLGELGQKAVTIIASDTPWAGQSCGLARNSKANMFEYSIIPVKKTAGGELVCDYSHMQRYIDIAAKYHIDREISIYGLCGIWNNPETGFGRPAEDYPDSVRIRYLDEADGCFKYLKKASDIEAYIASLRDYFVKTGQIDKVRIAADEPADIALYRSILGRIEKVTPEFKFKAAINHSEFIGEFGNEVYDFVPSLGSMTAEIKALKEYQRTMPEKRFLYYICCGPDFPNTFITSPLHESYYLGVLASACGFDGLLRWAYNIWPDEPRRDCRYEFWRTGDTHFVYPACDGSPILTLRWKALKRGITLYELLEKLKEKNPADAEKAMAMVMKITDIEQIGREKSPQAIMSSDISDYIEMGKFIVSRLG